MRKKRPPEHPNHERWLVSYADFITLLFAFFTTLYAISTVDAKKAGKLQTSMATAFGVQFFPGADPVHGSAVVIPPIIDPAQPVAASLGQAGNEPIVKVADNLERLARKMRLSDRVSIRRSKNGVVISLTEAGFFDSGRADVREDAVSVLNMVAEVIETQRDDLDITIEGHTDNVPVRGGRFSSNWELSTARATTVLAMFVGRAALDPAHLNASGYAEFRPMASNDTAEGRRRNRRVDIVVRPRAAAGAPLVPQSVTPTGATTATTATGASPRG